MATVLSLCALGAAPVSAMACADPPPPVLTLDYDSRYVDGDDTRSTVDEGAEAAAQTALDPLEMFLRGLATRTEAMLKADDPEARRAEANCITGHIAAWARAGALADQRSDAVRLTVGARLAALGIMLRAARAYTTDYEGLEVARIWLAARVEEQMQFWEVAPDGAARGNLRAWAALAAAAAADLNDDAVMRGWAAWSVTYVLCTADAEGALPQEMARGRLALHYQLHALAPLSTAALLLERQGLSLRDRCGGALERVARFALGDLETGARSAALSGAPQSLTDGSDTLKDFQLAWLEPYLALTGDAQARAWAVPRRPLSFSKLGGNQTLLWSPR